MGTCQDQVVSAPWLGVAVHARGFDQRPSFSHDQRVREILDAYLIKQHGSVRTSYILSQPRRSGTTKPDDLTLKPNQIRTNWRRHIDALKKKDAK